jgi:hypothetical protein
LRARSARARLVAAALGAAPPPLPRARVVVEEPLALGVRAGAYAPALLGIAEHRECVARDLAHRGGDRWLVPGEVARVGIQARRERGEGRRAVQQPYGIIRGAAVTRRGECAGVHCFSNASRGAELSRSADEAIDFES